jgi:hypothetical protein
LVTITLWRIADRSISIQAQRRSRSSISSMRASSKGMAPFFCSEDATSMYLKLLFLRLNPVKPFSGSSLVTVSHLLRKNRFHSIARGPCAGRSANEFSAAGQRGLHAAGGWDAGGHKLPGACERTRAANEGPAA